MTLTHDRPTRMEGAGIKPHLVKTFKVSSDPDFEGKLIDVVGLYMNSPDGAIVLSFDKKSQIQAFDRTQRSLPKQSPADDFPTSGALTDLWGIPQKV